MLIRVLREVLKSPDVILRTFCAGILALSPVIALADVLSLPVPDQVSSTSPTSYSHRFSELPESAILSLGNAVPTSFPIPVLFGVSLSDISPNFGDPRPGGRTHEGEDIMAKKGTPVVSPVAGVVLKKEEDPSGGNMVYEAISGGFTLVYMHLDAYGEGIASGTILEPGSLIGYAGTSGNAVGGPSHLHFEVHNASGVAIDPMPFLAQEFSPQQKIDFLNKILLITSNPNGLASFLASNFSNTFAADSHSAILIPPLVENALLSSPGISVETNTSSASPVGDLKLGSSGSDVSALQSFLINRATGSSADELTRAGATGSFGKITERALIEYQKTKSISPADGYYGGTTRAQVESEKINTVQTSSIPNSSAQSITAKRSGTKKSLTLVRDLHKGMSGVEVLSLQQFLNSNGFAVAVSGLGSPGNETDYFGFATASAVVRFQKAHFIDPASGYVGPLTRRALTAA